MTKELQEKLNEKAKENATRNIWTQKPKGTIILSRYGRIEAFEQSHPTFVCYQRRGTGHNCYIDSSTDQLWQMVIARESLRGCRFSHVIMDSEIENELYWNLSPCFAPCTSIEFFE